MTSVISTEPRFIDAWWNNAISNAISINPHTASDSEPEADPGQDFRKTILETVAKIGIKDLEPAHSFHHSSSSEESSAGVMFIGIDGLVVVVEVFQDVAIAKAWGRDLDQIKNICTKIVKAFPKKDTPVLAKDLVPIAFWSASANEASCYIKNTQCPSFSEIASNYSTSIRECVQWLIDQDEPDSLGKIILWHGPPGMGKTYAVRALAREWSDKLNVTAEVILDPEAMLGSAGYMQSVLLNDDNPRRARRSIERRKPGKSVDPLDDTDNERPPLRLIIIEDSAEIFSENCRSTPGFSRLLNLTDGIIGQGLRCIFLLTANEEVGKIDAAVMRPGRCIQTLKFPTFTYEEAQTWLKDHGCKKKLNKDDDISLADLYALKLGDTSPVVATSKFGFFSD